MTAATEVWTKPEDLTEDQKALKVVARWKYTQRLENGDVKAVNLIDGISGMLTAFVVEMQGVGIGDICEVREGTTRDQDVVILYKSGV